METIITNNDPLRTRCKVKVIISMSNINFQAGFKLIKMVFFINLLWVTPVYAYSDPGSGLLLFQLLGAGIVGCLFYAKKLRDSILNRLLKRKHDDSKG